MRWPHVGVQGRMDESKKAEKYTRGERLSGAKTAESRDTRFKNSKIVIKTNKIIFLMHVHLSEMIDPLRGISNRHAEGLE